MVYSYVFSTALLELPKPTQELRLISGRVPSALDTSAILATSMFINAEALPIWYRDATLSITLGLVENGDCCDLGILGDVSAAISPAALLQTSTDCTHGHLARSSLCKFRHVKLYLRHAVVERDFGLTDETWDEHMEHLTEVAKMIGAPGGGLRQLTVTLEVYTTKSRPARAVARPAPFAHIPRAC
jgi:hypothetical protein